jgi:glutamate--cysteine ligase
MYLFGASPALTELPARAPAQLETLSDDTLYLPYATSLRMSDLGYQNDAQSGLRPHENSLPSYVASLMARSTSPYAVCGARHEKATANGSSCRPTCCRSRTSTTTIRPKRVIRTGERPVQALCNARRAVHRGALHGRRPVRAGRHQPRDRPLPGRLPAVLRARREPADHAAEGQIHARNFARTVKEGRRPGLTLTRDGDEVLLSTWADELLERIRPLARLLDEEHNESGVHEASLAQQKAKVADPIKRRRRACWRGSALGSVPLPPSACARANCMRPTSATVP